MVARYAAPISYNFLNLIRLDDNAKTIFEKVTSTVNHLLSASFAWNIVADHHVSIILIVTNKEQIQMNACRE